MMKRYFAAALVASVTASMTFAVGNVEAAAAKAANTTAQSKAPLAGSFVGAPPSAAEHAAEAAASTPIYTPVTGITAEQVVERNIAARGGLAAWRAVDTLSYAGSMEVGGKDNTALPFEMQLKRGHKSRLELKVQNMTAVQIYDGTQGWKLRPYLNRNDVEAYTPAENKSAAAWEELDGPLIDHAAKSTMVKLLGTQTIDGTKNYVLELQGKSGVVRRLWIDGKTFLETKIDGEARKLDGKMHAVAVFYRDFKSENGLVMPHVQETVVEGVKTTHKTRFDKVVVNAPLADSLFSKPDSGQSMADSTPR